MTDMQLEFRREANRVIGILQMAKPGAGVDLLVALFEWAASFGKIEMCNELREDLRPPPREFA